jgi:NADPH-dependent ferric siderophore reductase
VVDVQTRSPLFRRITVGGPELVGLDPATPAASVRLLVPTDGVVELPEWNGNEYLRADGSRPPLRTLTPLRIDPQRGEVDVDILLHGAGPMASWAATADVGDPVALSGTGRGYVIEPDAPHLLAGDASAVPAIATILGALPREAVVEVLVEASDGTVELDGPTGMRVSWIAPNPGAPPSDALVRAVEGTSITPDTRVWVAGEAAAVQRTRRHLFDVLGLPRSQCTVRGYWKHGRAGDSD